MDGPVSAIAGAAAEIRQVRRQRREITPPATRRRYVDFCLHSEGQPHPATSWAANDQTPLAAKYSFDPNTNMLQMQLATADGEVTSDQFSFIGGIEVDEQGDLNSFPRR